MKIILPVFMALCLCVAPVLNQDVMASTATASETESADVVKEENVTLNGDESQTAPIGTEANVASVTETESLIYGSSVPQFPVLRAFGSMGIVLCLLISAYWGIRKIAPGYFAKVSTGGKNLKIVESIGMGDRRSIALIEVGGKRFLVGSTTQQINLLTALPEHFSLLAEDAEVNAAGDEGDKPVFRNLFDMGRKRSVRNSGSVLPDEIRRKMRQLHEALDNR